MHVIHSRNVNHALSDALWWLRVHHVREPSRNGPVAVSPTPVATVYARPTERVLLNAARDANPYFHLMEALWMLAGRKDLDFVCRFNPRMREFSDDGGFTQPGAYGYRWRKHFGHDQLTAIVDELRRNPSSRRCVLSMWSAADREYVADTGVGGLPQVTPNDLFLAVHGGKDVPCNTHAYVDTRGGRLNLTVLNRSNDILWGCYGANAVHFSVLQEYLAAQVGVPVGTYYQISCNWHLYLELPGYKKNALEDPALRDVDRRYDYGKVSPVPLVTDPQSWDTDLSRFLSDPLGDAYYTNPFFDQVAAPMYASWEDRQHGFDGVAAARAIVASDWRAACLEWIARREEKKARGSA